MNEKDLRRLSENRPHMKLSSVKFLKSRAELMFFEVISPNHGCESGWKGFMAVRRGVIRVT